jgi:hypothetical protein
MEKEEERASQDEVNKEPPRVRYITFYRIISSIEGIPYIISKELPLRMR